MVSRQRSLLAGVAAAAILAAVGAIQVVIAASGERTISLYNIHTKETVTVVYKKAGKYVDAGLEQVNQVLRDHRRNEATKMDPALIDILWEVHNELGSKEPIHIISGYRSRATNELLRRTVGGQASESRHILGKAADVHFPDVDMKKVRYSALIREQGGVGYYPTSAIPFVHIDTDRVRAWPRLPRYELALLFPSGTTKHAAAEGGPITKEDVRVAQSKYRDLAVQVAAFHDARQGGPQGGPQGDSKNLAVAAASPQPAAEPRRQVAALEPRLIETLVSLTPPRPIAIAVPSANDRAQMSNLFAQASAMPMLVAGPAPARRPATAMLSLAGPPGPTPAVASAALPAPKLAAINPAALQAPGQAPAQLADSGRFGWSGSWIPAPGYDEEHPEELSYRPFPIGPLLTHSINDPLMSEMLPHDVARTIDMLDQQGTVLPLKFRPGEQTAQLMWAQQFTGQAVEPAKIQGAPTNAGTAVQSRSVKTTPK